MAKSLTAWLLLYIYFWIVQNLETKQTLNNGISEIFNCTSCIKCLTSAYELCTYDNVIFTLTHAHTYLYIYTHAHSYAHTHTSRHSRRYKFYVPYIFAGQRWRRQFAKLKLLLQLPVRICTIIFDFHFHFRLHISAAGAKNFYCCCDCG